MAISIGVIFNAFTAYTAPEDDTNALVKHILCGATILKELSLDDEIVVREMRILDKLQKHLERLASNLQYHKDPVIKSDGIAHVRAIFHKSFYPRPTTIYWTADLSLDVWSELSDLSVEDACERLEFLSCSYERDASQRVIYDFSTYGYASDTVDALRLFFRRDQLIWYPLFYATLLKSLDRLWIKRGQLAPGATLIAEHKAVIDLIEYHTTRPQRPKGPF